MNQREEILSLLQGHRASSPPAFSGLIHVTAEGLQSESLTLYEAQHDAQKMARAAASTYRLTGMPSAALPLDLCAPAETLGAELDFYEGKEYRFPQVKKPLFESTREIAFGLIGSPSIGLNSQRGRLGIICEAIALVADELGREIVISGTIPGPYTLLLYLCNPSNLFLEMKREPQMVLEALFRLSTFLARVGQEYREAGADFITIHDMGGSPGFIGPAKYEQFVYPSEKFLITELPKPRVLSVCGNTNKSMELLAQTGAEAISVDQTNDLAASRQILTDTLLFGNIDPVATLWQGDEAVIRDAVRRTKEAGVDAVWPGCDLVPKTSIENIQSFIH
jgi:[methyl-Co(III) methanol-specific corrinoid protein]:coenzyme M methyltransferase